MIDGIIIHHSLSWISEFLFSAQFRWNMIRSQNPSCQTDFSELPISKSLGFLMEHCWQGRSEKSQKRRFSQGFMPFMNILERLDKKETKACVL